MGLIVSAPSPRAFRKPVVVISLIQCATPLRLGISLAKTSTVSSRKVHGSTQASEVSASWSALSARLIRRSIFLNLAPDPEQKQRNCPKTHQPMLATAPWNVKSKYVFAEWTDVHPRTIGIEHYD